MASSKRPTYKVETKLATERKRRKSDLVVMWQSIQGVTNIILNELWITLVRMWELIKLWFSSSERFLVLQWLEKYLPYVPEDFSHSWRDGRLLAILLNKLQPGCFPDATRLDPEYGLKNIYRVFDALEMYFRVKPNVSAEEIVTCCDGSEEKLFTILLELKTLTDVQSGNEVPPEPEPAQISEPLEENPHCIAKGTGLAVGFIGKMANFMIFCAAMSDLDVVVEIRGPNSICSERITKRSPRKKRSTSSWECAKHLTRSASLNQDDICPLIGECENIDDRIILLEYEITRNQISLGYKPKEKGRHKITILWHGWHVSDSPYFVTVEDPSEVTGPNSPVCLKSALRTSNETEKHDSRKISVRFQESQIKPQVKPSGKILKRKVLRYIVKIHGKDIPVNAENTESLATELLKMDYDFETCPSFHRRNSWGFTGDEERKKSVIRQFCVDVNELDAHISLRRSRSLSMSPGPKKLLEKSGSFQNLAPSLNILNETCFESNGKIFENENDYAYMSEEANEMKTGDSFEREQHEEIDQISLSSKLADCKLNESFKGSCEIKHDKISSLSTDTTEVERVDSTKDDPEQNIPSCSPIHKKNRFNVYKTEIDKTFFDHQRLNIKLYNNVESPETCSQVSKSVEVSYKDKISKGNSKQSHYFKKKYLPYPLKKSSANRKFHKPPEAIYRKEFKKSGLVQLTPVSISFRKQIGSNKSSKSKIIPSKMSEEFLLSTNLDEPSKPEVGHNNLAVDMKIYFSETSNISQENATKETNKESISVRPFIENKSNDKKRAFVEDSYRNITNMGAINIFESPNNIVEEPKLKKSVLNHNLIANTPPSIGLMYGQVGKSNLQPSYSLKSVEDSIINWNVKELGLTPSEVRSTDGVSGGGSCQPLRTHKLKALEQFNFKQFNPRLETPRKISPIKAQIIRWENALSSEKQNPCYQNASAADTEKVSVKEKLAFWENAYKTEQLLSPQNTFKNNRKMDLDIRKMSSEDNSDCMRNDPQNLPSTGHNANIPLTIAKEKNEALENKEINLEAKKQTDKLSSELQVDQPKIRRRSFSDPVASTESGAEQKAEDIYLPSSGSSKEYSSSSIEDNLEDSEDSGGDYILHSTEDEYIDDEISERASEYWGDLSIVNGWKENRHEADYPVLEEEFFLSYYQSDNSHAEECKVFGIAVYYGHVAVKNRFQVYTGNAGYGNLSVCMQGFRLHEVSLISVVYVRNDIYEVTYQVMTAGYYLISIRWMDRDIPGSPYVCKVTF